MTAVTSKSSLASGRIGGSTGLAYAAVLISGIAGLGYQIVWTRMLAVSLGHEIIAVLATVAAFFVGLAIGGGAANHHIRNSTRPQIWYAALEVIIGLWAVALIWIMPGYNQWMPQVMGPAPTELWRWCVAFVGTLVVLLPATVAMGATLPAMERIFTGLRSRRRVVGGLYGVNTLGAVCGTLLSTFVLAPLWGMAETLAVFAAGNFACAAAVLLAFVGHRAPVQGHSTQQYLIVSKGDRAQLLLILGVTGLLGVGFEVLVIRVLSQVMEDTVYTYAVVLAVYLLGTAAGAAWYQAVGANRPSRKAGWEGVGRYSVFCAAACLLGLFALTLSNGLYDLLERLATPSYLISILIELTVAASVFLVPTFAMGVLFSHLAQKASGSVGLGAALAANTLGCAAAPLLAGVLLLPGAGAKTALLCVVAGYGLLAATRGSGFRRSALVLSGLAFGLMLLPVQLRFVERDPGSNVIRYLEGRLASVAVIETPGGSRHLKVNNHFTMGGTATRYSDHRQTHLPLLLHGQARSALYLGLGTGITMEAAKFHPDLAVTGVELIPEMLDLRGYFEEPNSPPWPLPPTVLAADARRYVVASEDRFDVIVAEIFHPSRDGAGSLYTVEHFTAIADRLEPGGLFCQWLPLFQLNLDTLRTIVRTFVEVFPNAELHLGHLSLQQPILCLAGRTQPRPYAEDWLIQRVFDPSLQRELVRGGLNSDLALFGGFLAGTSQLKEFAGPGSLNTDNLPSVTYRAPHFVYGNPESPAVRINQLIEALSPPSGFRLQPETSQAFAVRLAGYWKARDVFLRAGLNVDPTLDVSALAAQIQQPLLQAITISPDFEPARVPLLNLAQSLGRTDRMAALRLLTQMEAADPTDRAARRLREQLEGYAP